MKRLTVMIAFGGESSEHDVSVNSARNVHTAIDTNKYDVKLAYIDYDGRWWLLDQWQDAPDLNHARMLTAVPGASHFLTVPSSEIIAVDVLLPVLHGKHGEDGSIQGLADMMHIPIVGCGIEASALCMNKDATKRMTEAHGVPVVPWVTVTKYDTHEQITTIVQQLDAKGPWFVKPSRAGSSVGVSKVATLENIPQAIKNALEHDDIVLIEVAVNGRELEVAVLGNPPHHQVSKVGEIIPGNAFYDYDDKYSQESLSKVELDAELPEQLTNTIRQYALTAYQAMNCSGLARVDFLLSDDMTPFMNEINTMPGFTNISMYPKLWHDSGIDYPQLIDRLIELAIE